MAARLAHRRNMTIFAAALVGSLLVSGCTTSRADASTFNACIDVESLQFSAISLSPETAPDCQGSQVAVSWATDASRANKDVVDSLKGSAGETGATGESGVAGVAGESGSDGKDGAKGESGTDGLDGAKGDAGATGSDGGKGEDGAPGSDGKDGAKGASGAAGNDGTKGQDGLAGSAGDPGAAGAKGDTGAAGLDGVAGAKGATGATGDQGASGAKGDTGSAGLDGVSGPKGETGAKGEQGETGAAGLPGLDGNSIHNGIGEPDSTFGIDGDFYLDTVAFAVYGPKADGAWPGTTQSLIGPEGPVGPSGPAGPQGLQGATGDQGTVGDTGAQGATGPGGATGAQGIQGEKGEAGAAGAPPVFMGTIAFIDAKDDSGFFAISGASNIVANGEDADVSMPRSGTLKGLTVAASSRSGTVSITLNLNDVATALTCEIAVSKNSCQELDQSVVVSDQDKVSFSYSSTGTSPVKNLRYAVGFEGQ